MKATLNSITHWYELADQQEWLARHYEASGQPHGSVAGFYARARVYRETARAMRLGLETGETWCSCHLRPSSEWKEIR